MLRPSEVEPLLQRVGRSGNSTALSYLLGLVVEAQREMAVAVARGIGATAGDYGLEEERFCLLLEPLCQEREEEEGELVTAVGDSEEGGGNDGTEGEDLIDLEKGNDDNEPMAKEEYMEDGEDKYFGGDSTGEGDDEEDQENEEEVVEDDTDEEEQNEEDVEGEDADEEGGDDVENDGGEKMDKEGDVADEISSTQGKTTAISEEGLDSITESPLSETEEVGVTEATTEKSQHMPDGEEEEDLGSHGEKSSTPEISTTTPKEVDLSPETQDVMEGTTSTSSLVTAPTPRFEMEGEEEEEGPSSSDYDHDTDVVTEVAHGTDDNDQSEDASIGDADLNSSPRDEENSEKENEEMGMLEEGGGDDHLDIALTDTEVGDNEFFSDDNLESSSTVEATSIPPAAASTSGIYEKAITTVSNATTSFAAAAPGAPGEMSSSTSTIPMSSAVTTITITTNEAATPSSTTKRATSAIQANSETFAPPLLTEAKSTLFTTAPIPNPAATENITTTFDSNTEPTPISTNDSSTMTQDEDSNNTGEKPVTATAATTAIATSSTPTISTTTISTVAEDDDLEHVAPSFTITTTTIATPAHIDDEDMKDTSTTTATTTTTTETTTTSPNTTTITTSAITTTISATVTTTATTSATTTTTTTEPTTTTTTSKTTTTATEKTTTTTTTVTTTITTTTTETTTTTTETTTNKYTTTSPSFTSRNPATTTSSATTTTITTAISSTTSTTLLATLSTTTEPFAPVEDPPAAPSDTINTLGGNPCAYYQACGGNSGRTITWGPCKRVREECQAYLNNCPIMLELCSEESSEQREISYFDKGRESKTRCLYATRACKGFQEQGSSSADTDDIVVTTIPTTTTTTITIKTTTTTTTMTTTTTTTITTTTTTATTTTSTSYPLDGNPCSQYETCTGSLLSGSCAGIFSECNRYLEQCPEMLASCEYLPPYEEVPYLDEEGDVNWTRCSQADEACKEYRGQQDTTTTKTATTSADSVVATFYVRAWAFAKGICNTVVNVFSSIFKR